MGKIQNILQVEYVCTTDISNRKFDKYIIWWSEQTKLNKHTLSLEPAEIRNNTIFAVFAIIGGHIVGAGGLMKFPNQIEVRFRGKPVIEFRANCVHKDFERLGIGKALHKLRIDYVDEHQLHSVMITQQTKILKIRVRFGWKYIEKVKGSHPVYVKIRKCKCHPHEDIPFVGERCETCPFFAKNTFLRLCKKVKKAA